VNRSKQTAAATLSVALLILVAVTAPLVRADAAPNPPPGMVLIPAGTVQPGCTREDYVARANNDVQKAAFHIEVWGRYPNPIHLPAFYGGQFEISNAQWKLYLDRNFLVKHLTGANDTLEMLAKKHIRHLGEPIDKQWKGIYGLNWQVVYDAMVKAETWPAGNAPEKPDDKLKNIFLPEGIELVFYSHPVPHHWFGWCKLSGLNTGKEYCDVRAAPNNAFIVPVDPKLAPMFARARLRAKDFKNYPIRDIAPIEALAFVEWAGGHLPSEYEFERMARNDKPNARQHPGVGRWEHGKQPTRFAFGENKACRDGPLPVDDDSVAAGDSDFGNRHILGNVHELTRTFWDLHPMVAPKPNIDFARGLFNAALIAKGGAFGSGYRFIQISTRTGNIGAELTLDYPNRADSLGLRLIRHKQPGYDLALHTIRRMSYNARLSRWDPPIHGYAMPRMAGADVTHYVKSNAADGYTYIQDKAMGIAFAPFWSSKMTKSGINQMKKDWTAKKRAKDGAFFLGVLRSDVPLRAGVPMKPAAWKKLEKARKARKAWEKSLKGARGPKLEELKANEPPVPAAPDAFEAATVKQKEQVGVWVEQEIPAGEWNVIYWYGFIGLTGRSKLSPPEAILMLDPKQGVVVDRKAGTKKSLLLLDSAKDSIELTFPIELEIKQKNAMPKARQSSEWALAETLAEGWYRRKVNPKGWRITVTIPTAKGALKKHAWNTK